MAMMMIQVILGLKHTEFLLRLLNKVKYLIYSYSLFVDIHLSNFAFIDMNKDMI